MSASENGEGTSHADSMREFRRVIALAQRRIDDLETKDDGSR